MTTDNQPEPIFLNNSGNPAEKKLSSARRIAASRANGARSSGPVTPEGKARSSQNARTHQLLAKHICLSPEEAEVYSAIFQQYYARFEPRDQAEHDLVEEVVFCKYQMRQAWMQQAAALGLQIALDKEAVDSEWSAPTNSERRVLALSASLQNGNTIPLLQRYARSLAAQAERALKQLLDLKKQRIPPAPVAPDTALDGAQPVSLRNEPNAEIECDAADSSEAARVDRKPLATTVYTWALPYEPAPPVHFPTWPV